MDKTVINVKTDKKLKGKAQEVAKALGVPLGTIINAYLRDFVRERRVVFTDHPMPNKKTQELLDSIERDIQAGRNLSGPFRNVEDALRFLHADGNGN